MFCRWLWTKDKSALNIIIIGDSKYFWHTCWQFFPQETPRAAAASTKTSWNRRTLPARKCCHHCAEHIYIEVAQCKEHVVQLSFSRLNEEKVSWTLRVGRGRTLLCSKKTPWLGVANALWAGDDMKVTQFQVRRRHQSHDRALDVSTVYLLHRPWRLFLPISNSSQRKYALETPLYLKR
jgi:hypothetical protein